MYNNRNYLEKLKILEIFKVVKFFSGGGEPILDTSACSKARLTTCNYWSILGFILKLVLSTSSISLCLLVHLYICLFLSKFYIFHTFFNKFLLNSIVLSINSRFGNITCIYISIILNSIYSFKAFFAKAHLKLKR